MDDLQQKLLDSLQRCKNDAIHHKLCKEFKHEWTQLQITEDLDLLHNALLSLIDSDKYRDVFIYYNKSYTHNLLTFINTTCHIYFKHILIHIITTRKIAQLNDELFIIARELNNDADVIKFFSFYSITEINDIIIFNILGEAFQYNKDSMKCNLIYHAVINNNESLFKYIITHAEMHNITLLCGIHDKYIIIAFHTLYYLEKCKLDMIAEHDQSIIFRLSLRYTWLQSCLLLYRYN